MPCTCHSPIQRLLMTTDTAGSVSAYALDLAQALQEYGIDVALATMRPPLDTQQHAAVRQIKNLTVFDWHQQTWQPGWAVRRFLPCQRATRRLASRPWKPDWRGVRWSWGTSRVCAKCGVTRQSLCGPISPMSWPQCSSV